VPARDDLRSRALAFIRKVLPFAYCDACLALRLEASLSEMTAVLTTLVADGEYERRRRACYGCGRTLELCAVRESPGRR
jgi:hypothetical protein